jgi:hypothetical protein
MFFKWNQKLLMILITMVSIPLLGLQAGALEGQSSDSPVQPREAESKDLPFSGKELDKIASAFVEISVIRQDLQEKLSVITEPEDARILQEEAGAKMVEAVQSNDLDVDSYNRAMAEVQSNEDLRAKLMAKIEAQR